MKVGTVRKKCGYKHPLTFKHCPVAALQAIVIVFVSNRSMLSRDFQIAPQVWDL